MLTKAKFDEMQSVIADCKTLNGMAFSGNHYKVSQFQKAPALLGEALDEILSLREHLEAKDRIIAASVPRAVINKAMAEMFPLAVAKPSGDSNEQINND